MRNYLRYCSALLLLHSVGLCALPVFAQSNGKKPSSSKPAAQKPAKRTGAVVLGTTQMPGEFGKLGTTYTIGKSTPINFTLNKADYSVASFSLGNNSWNPAGNEKLLILHYTVQNPTPREQRYYWADIRFTAVDAKDTNHDFIQGIAREGQTESLEISLKPAQKIDVVTAIVVPGEGVVPKLIVERERDAPVIRYDLRGKVTPLPAGFATSEDTSGASARKEIVAKPGTFYAAGLNDVRLDSIAYVTTAIKGDEPGDNKQYMTAIFTIKNRTASGHRYVWSDFELELRDSDGEKVEYNQTMLKATRDESADGQLAPGEEARVRFYFVLPKTVKGKTLRLAEGRLPSARVFAFDLTSLEPKTP